ncbi:EamA family transporter [Metabacillus indicus]|uniref:EamA family transporter n=1 Tax=Metabacillus indicus TaxID=246786 RepID=UPI0024935E0F|nr:DMT family transporter [Metabacillus indicus]
MIKYSILVFIGACSYGIISTIIKLAYKQGFSVEEVIGSQYVTGFLLFLICALLFSRKKVTWKQALFLMLTGTTTSFTGIFYGKSLETVPASIAIILLFQFTWIGILIEAVYLKKRPDSAKLFSVLLLLIGTFMAGNLCGKEAISLTNPGIIWGLLSAVSFSLFIFASGKVAAELPSLNRSLFMSFGAAIFLTILFTPDFMTNGSLQAGLWKFALPLGFFGVFIPVVLFSVGTPKIGSGLATIVGAAELPAAVLCSVFFLKESVNLLQTVGIILILAGIAVPQLVYFFRQKKKVSQALHIQ